MNYFSLITVVLTAVIFQQTFSAVVPKYHKSKGWKKHSKRNDKINNKLRTFACPGGKPTDVVLLLDTSKHLTKEQFGVQIQRAEHMVRLFRNFKLNDKHNFNRIAILTFSGKKVNHVVKFRNHLKIGPNFTDELTNILRNLYKKHVYDSSAVPPVKTEIAALKQLRRMTYSLRRGVAHVAFYFSADRNVHQIDLKRAKRIKRTGIYLYIFRLGPSEITFDQYSRMVESPVSDFVFDVKHYSDIDASVKKLLNMEHCNMQVSPGFQGKRPVCEAKRSVNLFLGVDPITLDRRNTMKILHFYEDLKVQLEKTNGDKIMTQIIFSDFAFKEEGKADEFQLPDYSSVLRKTSNAAASIAKQYPNRDAQNTVLLVLKSSSHLTKEMINQATINKDKKMEIYAIVAGEEITDFSSIVSKPTKDHLFALKDFEELSSHEDAILRSVCKGW